MPEKKFDKDIIIVIPDDRDKIIILPDNRDKTQEIIEFAYKNNITNFVCDPNLVETSLRNRLRIFSYSEKGDVVLSDSIEKIEHLKSSGKDFAIEILISRKEDEKVVLDASAAGAVAVFIKTEDWKIIPLENLVAQLQNKATKLYANIESLEEVQTMFGILERGVDGIIYRPKDVHDIQELIQSISSYKKLELVPVKIIEVKDAGKGERVCIDTASILKTNEGMLIGSQSDFFFLIYSEATPSKFTSPRPFRVNAGAVHSYILLPDFKTKYLIEIEAGDRVLVVDNNGMTKEVIVGRSKIESRPLSLVKVQYNGTIKSIILQNAETIRMAGKNGEIISITDLKTGDEVLAYTLVSSGRHFGTQIDEFILEK